jgi:hypothetical protein
MAQGQPGDVATTLNELANQLDQLDLTKLSLDDIKRIRNPILLAAVQNAVGQALQPQQAIRHTSYFSHLSHYSSAAF